MTVTTKPTMTVMMTMVMTMDDGDGDDDADDDGDYDADDDVGDCKSRIRTPPRPRVHMECVTPRDNGL